MHHAAVSERPSSGGSSPSPSLWPLLRLSSLLSPLVFTSLLAIILIAIAYSSLLPGELRRQAAFLSSPLCALIAFATSRTGANPRLFFVTSVDEYASASLTYALRHSLILQVAVSLCLWIVGTLARNYALWFLLWPVGVGLTTLFAFAYGSAVRWQPGEQPNWMSVVSSPQFVYMACMCAWSVRSVFRIVATRILAIRGFRLTFMQEDRRFAYWRCEFVNQSRRGGGGATDGESKNHRAASVTWNVQFLTLTLVAFLIQGLASVFLTGVHAYQINFASTTSAVKLAERNSLLYFVMIVGFVVSILGMIGRSVAEATLQSRYCDLRGSSNSSHKGRLCKYGLWAYSRHPNYFCDWVVWCGSSMVALIVHWNASSSCCVALVNFDSCRFVWRIPHLRDLFAVVSNLLPFTVPVLLLFVLRDVIGTKLGESLSPLCQTEDYRRYAESVNAFFPGPRRPHVGNAIFSVPATSSMHG